MASTAMKRIGSAANCLISVPALIPSMIQTMIRALIPAPPLAVLLASLPVVLAMMATPARASDYQSIGPDPAILYDAPTQRGRKLYVAPRGMPVEVVVPQGDWARVRDASGELAWVERRLLVTTRSLVTLVEAQVRAAPHDSATVLFKVSKGVLLEMNEPPASGWVRVRHRDGLSGYVRVAEVWGE